MRAHLLLGDQAAPEEGAQAAPEERARENRVGERERREKRVGERERARGRSGPRWWEIRTSLVGDLVGGGSWQAVVRGAI
jgi:hypothetical protein